MNGYGIKKNPFIKTGDNNINDVDFHVEGIHINILFFIND
jgi:hypothetical protein